LLLMIIWNCGAAQKVNKTEQGEDYLAELKEQLVLEWPDNKTINIVFHGHSVPSGYFRTPTVNTLAAYPYLFLKFLKEHYSKAVINCITTSIGGEQSEQGAKRFNDDVVCMKPDLLFIDYALNDRGIGLERAEKAWRSMIEEAQSLGIKLVLMTPTPDLNEDITDVNAPLTAFNDLIKELGRQYEVPVINVYDRFRNLKRTGTNIALYMSQSNHPNELGHKEVLKQMVQQLFGELQ